MPLFTSKREPGQPPAPEQQRVMYVAMLRAAFPLRRLKVAPLSLPVEASGDNVVEARRAQSPELIASLRR